jgi:hypothetical protein
MIKQIDKNKELNIWVKKEFGLLSLCCMLRFPFLKEEIYSYTGYGKMSQIENINVILYTQSLCAMPGQNTIYTNILLF